MNQPNPDYWPGWAATAAVVAAIVFVVFGLGGGWSLTQVVGIWVVVMFFLIVICDQLPS